MKQRSKVRTWLHRILALALLWQSSGVPQALAAPAARSWFRPPHEPTRQRCDWCPAFSFLLPGMDQWMESQTTAAAVVDHVIPHLDDKALFWDRNNWQPLCKRFCANRS